MNLGELIEGIPTAVLTTLDASGRLRSRPMAAVQRDYDGSLWFFTRMNSPKVHEVNHDGRVCLSYSEPEDRRYVSVSGKCSLVKDSERMQALWTPLLKAWFPEGLEDPDLSLLKVDVEQAEFWDAHECKMTPVAHAAQDLASFKQVS